MPKLFVTKNVQEKMAKKKTDCPTLLHSTELPKKIKRINATKVRRD